MLKANKISKTSESKNKWLKKQNHQSFFTTEIFGFKNEASGYKNKDFDYRLHSMSADYTKKKKVCFLTHLQSFGRVSAPRVCQCVKVLCGASVTCGCALPA